jgi:hypothetical protein
LTFSDNVALAWRASMLLLQRQFRHRVAEHVIVPLHQLLVKVLDREVRALITAQTKHPFQFFCGGTFR